MTSPGTRVGQRLGQRSAPTVLLDHRRRLTATKNGGDRGTMASTSSSRLLQHVSRAPRRCSHDCSRTMRSWSSRASRDSSSASVSASAPTTLWFASHPGRTTPTPCRNASLRTLFFLAGSRRTFVSTSPALATVAQRPPSRKTQLVSYPSPSEVREQNEDEDAPDIDFIPPEEAALEMTDRAAEVCLSALAFSFLSAVSNDVGRAAIAFYRSTREQRRGCVTYSCGKRRMPRIPVQDGAREAARAG